MNADYIQVCLLLAALSLKEIFKKYLWPKKSQLEFGKIILICIENN